MTRIPRNRYVSQQVTRNNKKVILNIDIKLFKTKNLFKIYFRYIFLPTKFKYHFDFRFPRKLFFRFQPVYFIPGPILTQDFRPNGYVGQIGPLYYNNDKLLCYRMLLLLFSKSITTKMLMKSESVINSQFILKSKVFSITFEPAICRNFVQNIFLN